MSYKFYKGGVDSNFKVCTDKVLRKSDNAVIPFDEANTDYQDYLAWKAIDGNEPEAAD